MSDNNKSQYNTNGERDGYWELYWSNGNPCSKGRYINGERIGCWEWYSNGCLHYKVYYL